MYKRNNQNSNFDDLPFDGDERVSTGWQIYRIHDDIAERLNNGWIVEVNANRM